MDWKKALKHLARRRGAARINAEGSRSHAERAIVVRWGNTATLRREPLQRLEIKEND